MYSIFTPATVESITSAVCLSKINVVYFPNYFPPKLEGIYLNGQNSTH